MRGGITLVYILRLAIRVVSCLSGLVSHKSKVEHDTIIKWVNTRKHEHDTFIFVST